MKTILIRIAFPFAMICTCFVMATAQLHEQEKQDTEETLQEFFLNETVFVQNKNEFQVTTKPAYWNQKDRQEINLPFQFEYGITNRLQIGLELPTYSFNLKGQRSARIGSIEVGLLYDILGTKRSFLLSAGMDMEISLRSSEKNNEEAEAAWQPSVHIAKKMGKVEMHSGLAAEITGSGSTYLYSLATVFSVGNWRPTFELNGDINGEKEIHLTPGVLWKGFDDFELGLGISKSIRKEARSWGIVFMITHEFYIL